MYFLHEQDKEKNAHLLTLTSKQASLESAVTQLYYITTTVLQRIEAAKSACFNENIMLTTMGPFMYVFSLHASMYYNKLNVFRFYTLSCSAVFFLRIRLIDSTTLLLIVTRTSIVLHNSQSQRLICSLL